jgi:hypothetical protein
MVATIDNRVTLVGVTSVGRGCAQSPFPGIYARCQIYQRFTHVFVYKIWAPKITKLCFGFVIREKTAQFAFMQKRIRVKKFQAAFCTKVLCAAFLLLEFGFAIFWYKNICAKADRKMLMKFTIG